MNEKAGDDHGKCKWKQDKSCSQTRDQQHGASDFSTDRQNQAESVSDSDWV
ncbi:hypothetical protein [Rubripirellula reticaptiva]|uniref:hypothetical protein n=1 Tax=Rubripirellula reticaptiva TaxID=2528013 RepID=UPI001648F235|nr:hypothetical protein [Rubripirellula reticaptiva]